MVPDRPPSVLRQLQSKTQTTNAGVTWFFGKYWSSSNKLNVILELYILLKIVATTKDLTRFTLLKANKKILEVGRWHQTRQRQKILLQQINAMMRSKRHWSWLYAIIEVQVHTYRLWRRVLYQIVGDIPRLQQPHQLTHLLWVQLHSLVW